MLILSPLEESDPIHELLESLGGQPSLCSLLGVADGGSNASLANLAQTEVCLTLTSKFSPVPGSVAERLDVDRLFVRTKQVCTKCITYLKVLQVLRLEAST